ncbi:MAG TPA: hypothetical protein VGJ15_12530 [Pirellulales bacterium]|jgi:hypothetical protein
MPSNSARIFPIEPPEKNFFETRKQHPSIEGVAKTLSLLFFAIYFRSENLRVIHAQQRNTVVKYTQVAGADGGIRIAKIAKKAATVGRAGA